MAPVSTLNDERLISHLSDEELLDRAKAEYHRCSARDKIPFEEFRKLAKVVGPLREHINDIYNAGPLDEVTNLNVFVSKAAKLHLAFDMVPGLTREIRKGKRIVLYYGQHVHSDLIAWALEIGSKQLFRDFFRDQNSFFPRAKQNPSLWALIESGERVPEKWRGWSSEQAHKHFDALSSTRYDPYRSIDRRIPLPASVHVTDDSDSNSQLFAAVPSDYSSKFSSSSALEATDKSSRASFADDSEASEPAMLYKSEPRRVERPNVISLLPDSRASTPRIATFEVSSDDENLTDTPSPSVSIPHVLAFTQQAIEAKKSELKFHEDRAKILKDEIERLSLKLIDLEMGEEPYPLDNGEKETGSESEENVEKDRISAYQGAAGRIDVMIKWSLRIAFLGIAIHAFEWLVSSPDGS